MWLCLRQGFFSLVKNSHGPGMSLRARNVRHLIRLKQQFELCRKCEVIHTTNSDYPYRIILTVRQAEGLLGWAVTQASEYTNFKNAVQDANPGDTDYQDFLHDVWARGLGLENPDAPQPKAPAPPPTKRDPVVLPQYRQKTFRVMRGGKTTEEEI